MNDKAKQSQNAAPKVGRFSLRLLEMLLAMIAVFMTVPMVTWMIFRGHGRSHSIEMAVAMLAPFFVINVLRLFGVNAPWFQDAEYTGIFLGMVAAMLYRRDHYTGKAGHSARVTH